MKIIAFAGSNSNRSINKQLAGYAASLFEGNAEVLDLNDFDVPMYSLQEEAVHPQPAGALAFHERIKSADLLVVSLAENNSSFNAAYKNLFDWISRWEKKQFLDKPMLLMGTSPGPGGAKWVHEHAMSIFPRHGADIKGQFLLPSFPQNFSDGKIINEEKDRELRSVVKSIRAALAN